MSEGKSSPGIDLEAALEIVDDVEEAVLEEDKTGATREMVAAGTCQLIRKRLRVHHGTKEVEADS